MNSKQTAFLVVSVWLLTFKESMKMRISGPSVGAITLLAIVLNPFGLTEALAQSQDVTIQIRFSGNFNQCVNASGGATFRLIACVTEENGKWDARLNAAFKILTAGNSLSSRAKSGLRDAQRAWLDYRDKACIAAGDIIAEGGTLGRLTSNDCFLQMTAQRAAELENFVSTRR